MIILIVQWRQMYSNVGESIDVISVVYVLSAQQKPVPGAINDAIFQSQTFHLEANTKPSNMSQVSIDVARFLRAAQRSW